MLGQSDRDGREEPIGMCSARGCDVISMAAGKGEMKHANCRLGLASSDRWRRCCLLAGVGGRGAGAISACPRGAVNRSYINRPLSPADASRC
jgi:hypothetical protein